MNERESKKQHEMWFKDEYPEDYLLFIHDASKETLAKFINSEKSWQALANLQGYKLAPVEPTEEMIDAGVNESDVDWKPLKFAYQAMIGAVE